MSEKTKIFFSGVKAAPYPGAARDGCPATSAEVVSWHAGVGGTYCNFDTAQDFAAHFGDFLRYAYAAGVADAKEELRERLGL